MNHDKMMKALNKNGIIRVANRGAARSGMNMLEVIYNGYAIYDRSEEYIQEGLTKWWNAFSTELGYFQNAEPCQDPVGALERTLEDLIVSQ